jgi:hypothetical protein
MFRKQEKVRLCIALKPSAIDIKTMIGSSIFIVKLHILKDILNREPDI